MTILAQIDWGEIAQTYGIAGALLIVILGYIGRVMLPRTYGAFDRATEAFERSLEKLADDFKAETQAQREEFRAEMKSQRETHDRWVQALLKRIDARQTTPGG